MTTPWKPSQSFRKNDEQAHGEYRTKRLTLEIYDAMAKAIDAGQPYRTILDPRLPTRGRSSDWWQEELVRRHPSGSRLEELPAGEPALKYHGPAGNF